MIGLNWVFQEHKIHNDNMQQNMVRWKHMFHQILRSSLNLFSMGQSDFSFIWYQTEGIVILNKYLLFNKFSQIFFVFEIFWKSILEANH